MFIDYVPVMLANMTAGLLILAMYLLFGKSRSWAAGFAMAGLVAFLAGLHMIFTWPLPGAYNIAFGGPSVLFGTLFLGAALAIARNWPLTPVGIYAMIAGAVAVLVGVRVIDLHLTASPVVSGVGFMLTGAGSILAGLGIVVPRGRPIRCLAAAALIVAAAIWAFTCGMGYWAHLASFAKYAPPASP